MKCTKCEICGNDFYYEKYKRKCCSNKCLSEYRKNLTTKQKDLNYDNVIGKISNFLLFNYKEYGIVKTLLECYKELHIAPKTYYKYCKKYNISYDRILSKYNIPRIHSKFQTTITAFVREYYKDKTIIEEFSFEDCLNPVTKYKLRFDIYIPDIRLIIECDGEQHHDINSYFNKLVESNGYTPVVITDEIKLNYCNHNNIKIIRIPYSEVVTKEYVYSYLCA